MALKVELKPHERIIIGSCVVTNTDQRARLLIDGDNIPILREKDILTPETANTPAKLVYLAVQLMYISPDPQDSHGTYFNLLRDIVVTVPTAWPIIEGINNCILAGDLYQALKEAKKLIAYEKQLLEQHDDDRGEPQGGSRRSAALTGRRQRKSRRSGASRPINRAIASSAIPTRRGADRRSPRPEFQHCAKPALSMSHDIGAVIDDRRADREPAVEHRRRRRGDTGLLEIDDDLAIDPVGIVGAIAEADDVEIDRREQFEPRLGQDACLEIFRERAAARDDGAEPVGAVGLQREPGLQRAETARQIRSEIAGPQRASRQPPRLRAADTPPARRRHRGAVSPSRTRRKPAS